ncbi:MAG: class II aldolase/adducin family protein [Desulfarculus sp.]|nr:class II aldolase/adducin family protein [Desulfarculus sp.]
MSRPDPRRELVRFARLAARQGYMVASDGNLSLRLDGERLLITPSGALKARLRPSDILEVDLEGRLLAGQGQPSAELGLHLAAYQAQPQAGAVIHAHPPLATAITLAGQVLMVEALPELLYSLGKVPTVAYATPGSAELARAAAPHLAGQRAVLLARHGTLTTGPDLAGAWALTEKLEHAAGMQIAAASLGGLQTLPPQEQARLKALGGGQAQAAPLPLALRVELKRLPATSDFAVEKIHADARGQAHLIIDDRAIRRVCVLTLAAGAGYRGGHLHWHKSEGFYVYQGRARAELVCAVSGERLELDLAVGDRLWIPAGIAHRFAAIEDVTFVEFTDSPYRAEDDVAFNF